MKRTVNALRLAVVAVLLASLSGCDDPQVYGSIVGSSVFGSDGGWLSGFHTSIAIVGRIR